ncbi:MAG: hypothetical protein WC289_01725 [Patescibacteria group bacterium]
MKGVILYERFDVRCIFGYTVRQGTFNLENQFTPCTGKVGKLETLIFKKGVLRMEKFLNIGLRTAIEKLGVPFLESLYTHPGARKALREINRLFEQPGGGIARNAIREYVDSIRNSRLRAAINPLVEELFFSLKLEQVEDNMPPKGKPNQPKQGDQPKGDQIAKARHSIAALDGAYSSIINQQLAKKAMAFQLIALSKLAEYTGPALKALAINLAYDADKADIYAAIGIDRQQLEDKVEKGKTSIKNVEKSNRLLARLPQHIRKMLVKVLGKADTPDDRESFYSYLAGFYGEGTDEEIATAGLVLEDFTTRPIMDLANAIGIMPNIGMQVVGKITRALNPDEVSGITDEEIRQEELELEQMVAERKRRWGKPESVAIVPATKYGKVS